MSCSNQLFELYKLLCEYFCSSIVVWEALVEGGGKGRSVTSGWGRSSSAGLDWLSLDHHRDGNIVVVRGVLLFVSLLSSDGVEGVVSNDLSEGLESDALDLIQGIGW